MSLRRCLDYAASILSRSFMHVILSGFIPDSQLSGYHSIFCIFLGVHSHASVCLISDVLLEYSNTYTYVSIYMYIDVK